MRSAPMRLFEAARDELVRIGADCDDIEVIGYGRREGVAWVKVKGWAGGKEVSEKVWE